MFRQLVDRKFFLPIIFSLPFILLGFITIRVVQLNGQTDIDDRANQLRTDITDPIRQELQEYLKIPYKVNQANAQYIENNEFDFKESGEFSDSDFDKLRELFSQRLQEQEFKQRVDNNYLGTVKDYFVSMEWSQKQKGQYGLVVNEFTKKEFPRSTQTQFPQEAKQRTVKLNPLERPWYKTGKDEGCEQPAWTEVYSDRTSGQPVISAVSAICNESGEVIAVLASDFLFSQINNFVKNLTKTSIFVETLIIERETEKLVATSRNAEIFTTTNEGEREQITATKSENPLIRKVAEKVIEEVDPECQGVQELSQIDDKGEKQFIQFFCTKGMIDLDWLVAVIIPENEIKEENNSKFVQDALLLAFLLIAMMAALPVIFVIYSNYKEKLIKAANRFVPWDFLENQASLNTDFFGAELGTQVTKDNMTIMFADIRSFTSMSEKMEPEEIFNLINNYLSKVSPAIRKHKGIVDKYIGDGIMALFPEPKSADNAIQAAVEMQQAVGEFNQDYKKDIRIGIGLHTGKLMLGIIGEPERLEVTVISDAVNVASRVEGLNKRYGAGIIISKKTLDIVSDRNIFKDGLRELGEVKVKGRDKPVSVFEIYLADKPNVVEKKNLTKQDFALGIASYRRREFPEAQRIFEKILQINPEDKAAQYYKDESSSNSPSTEELFGQMRGKVKYFEDLVTPTTEEWGE